MKDYTEYIDSELSDFNDPTYEEDLAKFKAKRKSAMRDREVVLRKRGLSDAQVIFDLIISENSNVRNEFIEEKKQTLEDNIEKRLFKIKILLSVVYFIFVGITYFAVSFTTHHWDLSWLIIVGSIVLYADFLLVMPRTLHYRGERTLKFSYALYLALILIALFVWLIIEIQTHGDTHISWIVLTSTLSIVSFFDTFVPRLAHEKHAIFHTYLGAPITCIFIYVTLGLTGLIGWHVGWLIIFIGIAISLLALAIDTYHKYGLRARAEKLRLERYANKEGDING